MALRNVVREESRHTGFDGWRLKGPDGAYIAAYDEFSKSVKDEKFATRKRYCEVVSRFIDYLYEVGILGKGHVSRAQVNQSIDYYLLLLRDGDQVSFTSARKDDDCGAWDEEALRESSLRKVAVRLGIQPLSARSWSNTTAPLNRFLRLCALLQEEAHEMALLRAQVDPKTVQLASLDARPLLDAVSGSAFLSRNEVASIRFASALGPVIRFRGEDLRRPRGIRGPKIKSAQRDTEVLDFPMDHFGTLLDAATCWRDRALWLLTAASGIRRSEALNVEWHHIDFDAQIVYVLDPEYLRYGRDLPESDRYSRFKGRAVSWTYLRMPYRQQFFEALLEYRRREYVLPEDDNDYVFQFVESSKRGVPYRQASDTALNKQFVRAVERAQIPGPPMSPRYIWTQHSLRHAYGVYMLNDFRVVGQELPGLTEAEVQLLMGHKLVTSTRKYARPKETRLRQKLAMHDQMLLGYDAPQALEGLPAPFIERLRLQQENLNRLANV
ncbi:site-specific recombinase XerD [Burkholderia sp. Ch1-1]|nr:site-specific recombinase XerD [Burkholderia sp. Ch1-1]